MKRMAHLNSVNRYLDAYIREWNFSGVVCISKDNEIVVRKSAGYACKEFSIANTPETCFSIGSISKQFTAFSIMQLFDKGEIDLHEHANRYLPNVLQIDDGITIHHLLSHTSGLHNFYNFDDGFFGEYNRNTYCKQDYFDLFFNRPLNDEPGEKFDYNNANYNVLAWIVEHIADKPFDQYLKEHIFIPLGMSATQLDTGTRVVDNKAFPYDIDRESVVRSQYYNEKYSIGAGAVVSNCADLLKWHSCLKHRKLLSDRAYAVFFKCNLNHYCYGLESKTIHGEECYLHGGDNIGVMAYMLNFFNEDLCIVILSNAGFGNQYKMGDLICDILFTGKYAKSIPVETVVLTDAEIKKYEGVYLDHKIELRIQDGKWEFVRYNGELHIPVRPIGNHQFERLDCDQSQPYTLTEREDGRFAFFGYPKQEGR